MNSNRWAKAACGLSIAAVAVAAGWISYTHIYEMTLRLGGSPSVAMMMPIVVDGMITVGSVVLLQDGGLLGWVGVIPGVIISVFANVMSGIQHGPLAAVWAGIPAVSFFTACFILERWLAKQARKTVTETVPVPDAETVPAVPEVVPPAVPIKRARGARTVTPLEVTFAAEIKARELPSLREVKTRARLGTDNARAALRQLEQLIAA